MIKVICDLCDLEIGSDRHDKYIIRFVANYFEEDKDIISWPDHICEQCANRLADELNPNELQSSREDNPSPRSSESREDNPSS